MLSKHKLIFILHSRLKGHVQYNLSVNGEKISNALKEKRASIQVFYGICSINNINNLVSTLVLRGLGAEQFPLLSIM